MKLTSLLLAAFLVGTTTLALAPTAQAAPPCWYAADKVDCVQDQTDVCVYGYTRDCIIYNPCNPVNCDPYWP